MKLFMMILPVILFCCVFPLALAEDLQVGFYSTSCGKAESIVRKVVETRFSQDKSITAALLRIHFHDCFVRGCDASVLIDSQKGNQSEKESGANESLRGFDLIDEIKKDLEIACPATVSCADIIALATRDSVALAGGPIYNVPTGRRDGLVSTVNEVNLPGPEFSVSDALQSFNAKGMSLEDMVTLLGAHTVGFTHCSFVDSQINNGSFPMDPDLRKKLIEVCDVDQFLLIFWDGWSIKDGGN